MNLSPVTYQILFNSKNITKDISEHLLALNYTDKVEGEADELEIILQDSQALWQNDWYPEKGATIEAKIIDDNIELPCGKFSLDEKEFSGGKSEGDTFRIAGVSASITKKLRTKRSVAHENKTLRQLAQTVADRHGLKLQGTIPDITIGRVTQYRKTDLAFLSTLSSRYGLVFSVRGDILTFHKQTDLEKKKHSLSLDRTEVTSFKFLDKSDTAYESVKVSYHNPETDTLVEKTGGPVPADFEGSADDYTDNDKAENDQQAELMAQSQQRKIVTRVQTASFECPGNILLVSGNNVELTGFGKPSGIYHITESRHSLQKDSSYTTSCEAKRVDPVPPAKYKPKKKIPADAIKVFNADGPGYRLATYKRVGNEEILTYIN
jgi:phage protein D